MASSGLLDLTVTVFLLLTGGYSESSMGGGYTQSPGGFASPSLSQGGEKKGVSTERHYL